jgi:hypothetical protein
MMQEISSMSINELKKLIATIHAAIHMKECGYGLSQATPAQVEFQRNRRGVFVTDR